MALFIPTAGQCLAVAAPVATVGACIWFLRHGDRVIGRLFPNWEWERKLGWLNHRAHRRAETVLRGVRHLLHAFLLLALVGVLGLSWLAGQPHDMDTAPGIFAYALELIDIGVCLAPWIYYFVAVLRPRIIAEYEEDELQRYRTEHPDEDEIPHATPPPRVTIWETTRSFRRL
jgi:hypothetical protein